MAMVMQWTQLVLLAMVVLLLAADEGLIHHEMIGFTLAIVIQVWLVVGIILVTLWARPE